MLQLLISFLLLPLHDHHVSVCEIFYNPKNESLEVIHSVFADDLEKSLKKQYDKSGIDLLSEEQFQKNDLLVKKYFAEHFRLFQNDKLLSPNWIGFEVIDHQLTAYFEYPNITSLEKIKLKDFMLIDEFKKQQNMVHWKFGEEMRTTVLSRRETEAELMP